MALGRGSKWVLLFTAAVLLPAAVARTSTAAKSHVVGGTDGWTIPPDGFKTYSVWAASQTFVLGDILAFEFLNGVHDVTQVTKTDFDECNTGNPIAVTTESPAKLTLNATGEFYYICGFPGHCDAGQKVSVKVVIAGKPHSSLPPAPSPAKHAVPMPATRNRHDGGGARSPAKSPVRSPAKPPVSKTPARSPAKSPAKPPARSQAVFTVGDQMGWMIPPNITTYQDWATGKNFMVGDILVFNYRKGSHDVTEVTRESFDTCTTTTAPPPPSDWQSGPPIRITLTTGGPHFFLCTVYGHCPLGQRLAITVADTTGAIPPALPPISTYGRDTAAATAPLPEKSAGRTTAVAAGWYVAACAGYAMGLLLGFM